RAALRRLEERQDSETSLRLAGALGWFWWVRGHFGEGQRWLESALVQGRGVSPVVRAKALAALGVLLSVQGDYARAISLMEESLTLNRGVDDPRAKARTLLWLGRALEYQGETGRAVALSEEALALSRELGDAWLIA